MRLTKAMLFLGVIVTFSSLFVFGQTFEPGCSFSDGQCLYNVKLGHQGQCDETPVKRETGNNVTTTATPNIANSGSSGSLQSCSCQDITAINGNVDSLWSNINTLQTNFQQLAQALNVTQEQLGLKESELAALLLDKQSLGAQLMQQQILVNKSKVELSNTVSKLNAELERLRNVLDQSNTDLLTCQSKLGTVSTSKMPALYGDYAVHVCDFEDSHYCNYTLASCTASQEECWHIGQGRQDVNSGPVEDHTFGAVNGHYMYINPTAKPSYNHPSTRTARMTTPELPSAHEYCLRFWYTMNGDNTGSMRVYAQVGGGDGYPIYTKTGQEDLDWHMAQLSIDSEYTAQPFKIVFEATTDSYYTYQSSHQTQHDDEGYTSIDDIYIYNTSCSSIPECPAGSAKRDNGNITSCYTFHVTPMGWYDAAKVCKSEAPNGHLVSVNSPTEQGFLVDHIHTDASLVAAGGDGWYTSGNDERVEGYFKWTDTGFPHSVNYTNWHVNQPNNVASNQDCLLLEYGDQKYEWGDVNCDTKHPFICEIHM